MRNKSLFLAVLMCFLTLGKVWCETGKPLPPPAPAATSAQSVPDQSVPQGRYAFNLFTDRDGLPQNSIMALTFDRQGYLWVGTQDGAAFYNGRKWTVIQFPNRTTSNFVRAICASADGSLWFGSVDGGLFRLKDSQWTVIDQAAGLPGNTIWSILEETGTAAGQLVLWVGTSGGLVRLEFNPHTTTPAIRTFTTATGLPHNRITTCLETRSTVDGHCLWVGTLEGLARFKLDADLQPVPLTNVNAGLPSKRVMSLLAVPENKEGTTLWVGTAGGLARWKHQEVTTVTGGPPGLNTAVRTLATTPGKNGAPIIWAGTDEGLGRFEQGAWTFLTTRSGLPNNRILSLLVSDTPTHTLWVGTIGGLARFESATWKVFDTSVGLPSNLVLSIAETTTPESVIWIGTQNGLVQVTAGQTRVFDSQTGLPNHVISCLLGTRSETGTTRLWAGTFGGLVCYENGQWRTFTKTTGLPGNEISCLLATQDATGKPVLWVGTTQGVGRLAENTWTVFDTRHGLPLNLVNCLFESVGINGERTLWVGTSGGLAALSLTSTPPQVRVFTTEQGLPNNVINTVTASAGSNGRTRLWVGSYGGLSWCDLDPTGQLPVIPTWTTFTENSSPALPNKVVYQLRQDQAHRLYAFTNKGIARLTSQAGETGGTYQISIFSAADGLPSNECNNGAAFTDSRGHIWVGTVAGAAVYDPTAEIDDTTPKPLRLEQSLVLPANSTLRAGTSLLHFENHVLFEYALLSYFREGDIRYQTQLVGFDDKPGEWTTDFKKEYTNLPAGTYQFQVWGRDHRGNVSGPETLSFVIRPAPWRTWWFYLFAAGAGSGFLFLIYSWRLQVHKRRQYQRIESLRRLLESIRVINSQLELAIVLQNIAEEGARLVKGEPGGIGILEGDQVVFRRLWMRDHWEDTPLVFRLGEGVAGKVAATAQPLIVNDPLQSPEIAYPGMLKKHFVHGMMDVPIITRTGKVVGVLDVRRPKDRPPFTIYDCKLTESLAHQAAIAIENAGLYGELEEKNLLVVESMRELERLYQQEREVTQTLHELNQMKTSFMMVTAHEMRTPLTVLRGYIEAICGGLLGPLPDGITPPLAACNRMIERLTKSVEAIQEMLRIHEGQINLKPEMIDFCALLREVAEELTPFIRQRRQQLVWETPETVRIVADSEKIRLVLVNLIQNAVKFTYDEGEIRIAVTTDQKTARLTVTDSGIGIVPSEIERIFEKFYTTSDASTHQSGQFEFASRGTGLGLAIAKSYIELHGGKIWAESDGAGHGSTFQVVLPLAEPLVNVHAELMTESHTGGFEKP
ncbi:MAG: GAF domain-containing protein [Blastocatellia bacterium]|nr:GAF domain-containing protein [Blastocatellia bacterium]